MSPLQFAHAAPNSAGTRSAWKRSRRQRWNRKNITPTSITLWLAQMGAGAQGVRPACLVLHPRNAGAKWLRSLLEQKGGVQAALLSYIRKPIISKPHRFITFSKSSSVHQKFIFFMFFILRCEKCERAIRKRTKHGQVLGREKYFFFEK